MLNRITKRGTERRNRRFIGAVQPAAKKAKGKKEVLKFAGKILTPKRIFFFLNLIEFQGGKTSVFPFNFSAEPVVANLIFAN